MRGPLVRLASLANLDLQFEKYVDTELETGLNLSHNRWGVVMADRLSTALGHYIGGGGFRPPADEVSKLVPICFAVSRRRGSSSSSSSALVTAFRT